MTQAYVPPQDAEPETRGPNAVLLTALAIVVLAVLVAVGAYFAGRGARPGEDARVRVPVPEVVAAAEAVPDAAPEPPPVEPARPPTPFRAFDLAQLHPSVAEAVTAARDVQDRAIDASIRAQAAARRAEAGAPGAAMIVYDGGDVYAGEVVDGGRHGAGVYTWSNPQEDSYAGEFADDAMDGLGVKRWKDGAIYFGDRRRAAREGHGVFIDAAGGGYEGAWANGAPNGYGVLWDGDGTVRAQGLWADNTLVEAWVVPTPVPTVEPDATSDADESEPSQAGDEN